MHLGTLAARMGRARGAVRRPHDDLGEKYERKGSNHQSLMVESCEQLRRSQRSKTTETRDCEAQLTQHRLGKDSRCQQVCQDSTVPRQEALLGIPLHVVRDRRVTAESRQQVPAVRVPQVYLAVLSAAREREKCMNVGG